MSRTRPVRDLTRGTRPKVALVSGIVQLYQIVPEFTMHAFRRPMRARDPIPSVHAFYRDRS